MLRIAERGVRQDRAHQLAAGSSFDLSPTLGRFRLVTMGRSFHWMDRAETLRRLDGMIEPGGAVALFDSEHRDECRTMPGTSRYRALRHRYAEDDPANARRRAGVWVRHEAILLDSAFSRAGRDGGDRAAPVDARTLVDRAFSRSSTAPDRLGEAATSACGGDRGAAARAGDRRDADRGDRDHGAGGAPGRRGRCLTIDPAWEARKLLRAARVGTLASPADGQPFASLVTPACAPDLSLLLLLSDLSEHTRHLRAEPRCSVLVAGPPDSANPQTAPRVTVTGLAELEANRR